MLGSPRGDCQRARIQDSHLAPARRGGHGGLPARPGGVISTTLSVLSLSDFLTLVASPVGAAEVSAVLGAPVLVVDLTGSPCGGDRGPDTGRPGEGPDGAGRAG